MREIYRGDVECREDIVCSVVVLGWRGQGRGGVLCAWSEDVIH